MVYFVCRSRRATTVMLSVLLGVSLAAVLFLGVAGFGLSRAGAAADEPSARDLTGTVVVPFGVSADPVSCYLSVDHALAVLGKETTASCPSGPLGDYSDVAEGTEVRILDQGGAELGVARLTDGVASGGTVTFSFVAAGLPAADGYRFAVNARGAVDYDADQLARDGWHAEVDLR